MMQVFKIVIRGMANVIAPGRYNPLLSRFLKDLLMVKMLLYPRELL